MGEENQNGLVIGNQERDHERLKREREKREREKKEREREGKRKKTTRIEKVFQRKIMWTKRIGRRERKKAETEEGID